MVNSGPLSAIFFKNTSIAPVDGFTLTVDFSREFQIPCHKSHITVYVDFGMLPMTKLPSYFLFGIFVLF